MANKDGWEGGERRAMGGDGKVGRVACGCCVSICICGAIKPVLGVGNFAARADSRDRLDDFIVEEK